jgi:hypothetical protein
MKTKKITIGVRIDLLVCEVFYWNSDKPFLIVDSLKDVSDGHFVEVGWNLIGFLSKT